jgi:uncharacterized membrane protein
MVASSGWNAILAMRASLGVQFGRFAREAARLAKETETARVQEKDTARVEAFSDGVFAVAITLLVLDLQVPKLGNAATPWELAGALAKQWPAYVGFVTSFFTVLIMWVNHHGVFRLIHKTSARLLFVNGYLLMMTTAVPFSTSLVTQYLRYPGAKAACAVYAGTFVLISLGFSALWRVITHRRELMKPGVSEQTIERISGSWRWGPPMYVAATLGAFLSPYITIGICTTLWVYWSIVAKEF